jgi:hypothetical protein
MKLKIKKNVELPLDSVLYGSLSWSSTPNKNLEYYSGLTKVIRLKGMLGKI